MCRRFRWFPRSSNARVLTSDWKRRNLITNKTIWIFCNSTGKPQTKSHQWLIFILHIYLYYYFNSDILLNNTTRINILSVILKLTLLLFFLNIPLMLCLFQSFKLELKLFASTIEILTMIVSSVTTDSELWFPGVHKQLQNCTYSSKSNNKWKIDTIVITIQHDTEWNEIKTNINLLFKIVGSHQVYIFMISSKNLLIDSPIKKDLTTTCLSVCLISNIVYIDAV